MRTEVIYEFLVFARHLSFSRAAEELHITQPNLSKHMADLEREVGVQLIDRKTYGKNRPVLSEAGKYFFEEMSFLETGFRNTLKRCQVIGRSIARDIRILELWQNNAMIKLYALAGAYQTEHPINPLCFVRLTQKHPIDALLENEFDVVFDVWCGPHSDRRRQLAEQGVRSVHVITEPLVIWYERGNRYLEDKSEVKLEELLDIPVIITRGGSMDYMVAAYANYCEREGLSPRLRHLQPMDNSPTGMFMSDFHEGVLMTSPAMMHDPRLRSRPDLECLVIDDNRVSAAFLLSARLSDKESVAFLKYVDEHKNDE